MRPSWFYQKWNLRLICAIGILATGITLALLEKNDARAEAFLPTQMKDRLILGMDNPFPQQEEKSEPPRLRNALNENLAIDGATYVIGEIWVMKDGTMRGTIRTSAEGSETHSMQLLITEMNAVGANDIAGQLLRRQNLEGYATIGEASDINAQSLALDISFVLINRVEKDGSLRVPLHSGLRVSQMPQARYIKALRERSIPDGICQSLLYEQNLTFHLPDAYFESGDVKTLPDYLNVDLQNAKFTAQYQFEDHRLHIKRRLSIHMQDQICTGDVILDMAPAMRAAAREFNRILTISPITQ